MVSVLHTGDTHLGYHQYHKPGRERDFMDAFKQTIQAAIDDDADVYVHAGDLFNDSRPSPQIHQEVLQELNRLGEHDIPFFSVVGNHDRATRGQWVDLFEEAGTAVHLGKTPEIIGNTAFYGLDYLGEGRRKQFEYQFEDAEDVEYKVLVAHGQFAPLTPGEWDLRKVLKRSNIDFDMVLLGDDHMTQVTTVNGTQVTYCGSTERTAADQRDERTYNWVTLEDGMEIDQRPLDTRPFEYITVELEPGQGHEVVTKAIDEADTEDAVVCIIIEGEGEKFPLSRVEEHADSQGAFHVRTYDRREFDEEIESVDVDFANPDDAVEARVEEMGFGATVRDLEREVRDEGVAKTNLKQRAKERVKDDLEADPERLTRPESEPETETDGGEPQDQDAEADEQDAGTEHTDSGASRDGDAQSTSLTDFTD